MQIEFYDIPSINRPQNWFKDGPAGSWQEHERLAARVGMDAQSELATTQLLNTGRPTITSQPLAEEVRLIWVNWLPERWRGEDRMKLYDYGPLPISVLRKLDELRAAHLFDEFELRMRWAPRECALMGIRDGKTWLVSRWSTYERLRPSAAVFGHARDTVEDNTGNHRFCSTLFFLMGAGMLWSTADVVRQPEMTWIKGWPGLVLSGIAFFISMICWIDRKDQLWKAVQLLDRRAPQES